MLDQEWVLFWRVREKVRDYGNGARITLNFSRQPARLKLQQPDRELPVEPGLADLYDGKNGKGQESCELHVRG